MSRGQNSQRWIGLVTAGATLTLIACGGGATETAPAPAAPAPKASAAVTQAAPTTAAASGTPAGSAASLRTLGAVKFADRGTMSAAGKTEVAIAVEDFAFIPTFIQGTPGQKVTLQLTNDTSTPHNLSLKAQEIDRDVPAKSKATVEVTVPQSGVLLFFCKFHTSAGMNGELLSGTGAPSAVDAPAVATPAASTEYGY